MDSFAIILSGNPCGEEDEEMLSDLVGRKLMKGCLSVSLLFDVFMFDLNFKIRVVRS